MSFPIYNNDVQVFNSIDFIPASVEQYKKETTNFHRKNPRVAAHKTVVVKIHSNVHARVQAFHEYLNEKKKYRQCVDGRDYKLCRKADSLAGKMFRSGY